MLVEDVLVGDIQLVVKRAGSDAELALLDHERDMLRRCAHPGVVRLAGPQLWAGEGVATRRAGPCDLSQLGALSPDELCGLGAAVATTIADLHDLGVAHHRLCDGHIVLSGDGAPVLCGFSHAGPLAADPGAGPGDVRALATVLLLHAGEHCPGPLVRLLRHARAGTRPLGARALATALARCSPAPRLPAPRVADPDADIAGSADPPGIREPGGAVREARSHRIRPSRFTTALAALALLGVALGVRATSGRSGGPGSRQAPAPPGATPPSLPPARATGSGTKPPVPAVPIASLRRAPGRPGASSPPCPAVDAGCRPLPMARGVFSAAGSRWRVSPDVSVVVLGRFSCGAALPAVLERDTGQVWVFASWPAPGRPPRARLVARARGAWTLRPVAEPTEGCDRLLVVARSGSVLASVAAGSRT